MTHPDMSWYEDAACSDMDNSYFFTSNPHKENVAKFVCSLCPVRKPCLRFAMKFRTMRGLWGGLTYAERKRLRQRIEERRRIKMLYEGEETG